MATQTHRLTDHERDKNDRQKIRQVRQLADPTAPPPLKRVSRRLDGFLNVGG